MTDATAPARSDDSEPVSSRYASVAVSEGTLVVYDRKDDASWVQSNAFVSLSAVR